MSTKNRTLMIAAASVMARNIFDSDEYTCAWGLFDRLLDNGHRETLQQLARGPVHDGELVSKISRDDLVACGLAVKCAAAWQPGYQVLTPQGLEAQRQFAPIELGGSAGRATDTVAATARRATEYAKAELSQRDMEVAKQNAEAHALAVNASRRGLVPRVFA